MVFSCTDTPGRLGRLRGALAPRVAGLRALWLAGFLFDRGERLTGIFVAAMRVLFGVLLLGLVAARRLGVLEAGAALVPALTTRTLPGPDLARGAW